MNLIKKDPIARITFSAICLALYVILTLISIETPIFKITLDGLPVIFAAIVLGPVEGFSVGLLGSFIGEFFSPYGLTLLYSL